MQPDWSQFFLANASAMFALAGALGGGVLSFFGAMLLKKREFNLAIWGKLLERRISAHEVVISLATEMRVMFLLGGVSASGEVRRAPNVMASMEAFEEWFGRFTRLSLEGTSWLSTETKREMSLVQDYLVTLHMHLAGIPSDRYPELGEVVRQDFIDFSASLERKAFDFFKHEIRSMRLDSPTEWHKYERQETERRLKATALGNNFERFAKERSGNAR